MRLRVSALSVLSVLSVLSALSALSVLSAGTALAQREQPPPAPPDFSGMVVFWTGALIIMALMGRVIFREQLHERRTIRRLIHEIGPFFPEFDTDALHKWVHLCAPHVWHGWRVRDMSGLADFATPAFLAESAAAFEQAKHKGQRHDARLDRVLKIHPLGIYMVGSGPPPMDLELMLRLESKGVDQVLDPDGAVITGKPFVRQVQHLWTLRHDGRRWRLHRVVEATDDVTDLAKRPPAPAVAFWKRPPTAPGAEESA